MSNKDARRKRRPQRAVAKAPPPVQFEAKSPILGQQAPADECDVDTLEDLLDRRGVPDELLEVWGKQEASLLASCSCDGVGLPPWTRSLALKFMAKLLESTAMPTNMWFKAVTVFDIAHRRVDPSYAGIDPQAGERSVMLTSAAVVMLLQKFSVRQPSPFFHLFISEEPALANWLRDHDAHIKAREQAVLAVLEWRLDPPSLESWAAAFAARLQVLTGGEHDRALERVLESTVSYAKSVLQQGEVHEALPPRDLAAGLFLIGLCTEKLLSKDALRGGAAAASDLLGSLERATGSGAAALRRCAALAAARAQAAAQTARMHATI